MVGYCSSSAFSLKHNVLNPFYFRHNSSVTAGSSLHILPVLSLISSVSVHRYWSSAWPPVHPSDWLSQWPLQQQLRQTTAFHLAALCGSPSGACHHSPRWCASCEPRLGWPHLPGRTTALICDRHDDEFAYKAQRDEPLEMYHLVVKGVPTYITV